jgi:radical SAM superfamily enzyme YgiQ (UPF0313 family)
MNEPKRIVFIEPKAPDLHIFSQFPIPRLGIFILGTLMKELGWEVEIVFEESRAVDYEGLKKADLVGISTITSTAPRAYAIADRVRGLGVPVLMGGPHVTYLADEALEHADFVIRGEGEGPLMAFIDAWERGKSFASVPGLSYRDRGRSIHNPQAPPAPNLDDIPIPDFAGLRFRGRSIAGRTIIPVQTSRGCPFDCSFCSVTGMFGKTWRFRTIPRVLEELRRYNSRRNFVFFYDDNFAANPARTKALLMAMIVEKFRFRWSTQVRADVARDPELVRLMKKAGCHTVFIGFESVNPRSLAGMKKKQTVEDIALAVRIFRRERIHVHGMFVFGFDEDDWDTVKKTVRFAKKARLTSTQFLILTPLPGSEFFEKMAAEHRILFRDWSLYDAHHVVFRPARLSLPNLQRAQSFAHRKFYSLVEIAKRLIRGRWLDLSLAAYARRLNRLWKKKNRTFLKAVDLLRPRRNAVITVDYHPNVRLDS